MEFSGKLQLPEGMKRGVDSVVAQGNESSHMPLFSDMYIQGAMMARKYGLGIGTWHANYMANFHGCHSVGQSGGHTRQGIDHFGDGFVPSTDGFEYIGDGQVEVVNRDSFTGSAVRDRSREHCGRQLSSAGYAAEFGFLEDDYSKFDRTQSETELSSERLMYPECKADVSGRVGGKGDVVLGSRVEDVPSIESIVVGMLAVKEVTGQLYSDHIRLHFGTSATRIYESHGGAVVLFRLTGITEADYAFHARVHMPLAWVPLQLGTVLMTDASSVNMSDGSGALGALPGYCYLEMVKPAFYATAVVALGPYPTLAELMTSSGKWYRSNEELYGLQVLDSGDGTYHIAKGQPVKSGSMREFLASAAAAVEDDNDRESLGSRFFTRIYRFTVEPMDVRTRVGVSSAAAELLHLLPDKLVGVEYETEMWLAMRSRAMLGHDDKSRLRMLAAVGDAALTLLVAEKCAADFKDVQVYQETRSGTTSNVYLAEKFSAKPMAGMLVSVGPPSASVGAEALEAVLGAVMNAYGLDGVKSVAAKYFDLVV